MELNAEQIKKALECCATKQFCAFDTPCPWEYMHSGNRLYADALALINSQEQKIKELTELSEAISERYAIQVVTAIELDKQVQRLTEENERLKAPKYRILPDDRIEMLPTVESVRADTIRKFAERTKTYYRHTTSRPLPATVEYYIDQIANEMLKEDE